MKILHITDHLPLYHKKWGGAEQVAYRYIQLSCESKNEIIVAGVKPENPIKEKFQFLRVRVLEDLFPEKFQIYITGLKNRILSFDPISFFHLLLILSKEKPHIIHLHKFNKISMSVILASKLMGAKSMLGMYDYWYVCPGGMLIDQKGKLCRRFHGSWCGSCDAVEDFRFLLPFLSPFRRSIFDFFFSFIDKFLVLSKAQGKLLEEYGLPKEKISLLRQVFNFPKENFVKDKENKEIILFSGWMDFRKGLHTIIDALPYVLKNHPKIELWVLKLEGIKKYEEMILKKIKKMKLNNKIKIYGRLSKEEFNKILKKASVIVVPEQWENMSPVIVVEAMANAKVIVASNIGGIPEFINDGVNGYLSTYNNPEEFAEKISLVLDNHDKSEDMAKRANQDIVNLCSHNKIYKDLLKLYGCYETKQD